MNMAATNKTQMVLNIVVTLLDPYCIERK